MNSCCPLCRVNIRNITVMSEVIRDQFI
jgi:hypothetical protein